MNITVKGKENSCIKMGAAWILLVLVLKIMTMLQLPMAMINFLLIGLSFSFVLISYIRNQEKEDMMSDNLSKKEYVDPFKG